MDRRIDNSTHLSTDDDVRDVVNRWSKDGFFRAKRLGDRITVTSVTPGSANEIRLRTQYEDRLVSQVSEAYRGVHLDNLGVGESLS